MTLTKLHCWTLTQFSKCVFLDADTLVVANCDDLFDREEFSAAPDAGWPDCFNSGVFVFRPNIIRIRIRGDEAQLEGEWPIVASVGKRGSVLCSLCVERCVWGWGLD